jgi:hypothetical protein
MYHLFKKAFIYSRVKRLEINILFNGLIKAIDGVQKNQLNGT